MSNQNNNQAVDTGSIPVRVVSSTPNSDPISGSIPVGGVVNVDVSGRGVPMTATLNSAATNRAINLSTNRLATPAFPWPNDAATTGMIATAIDARITTVQFVGASGDTYEVL